MTLQGENIQGFQYNCEEAFPVPGEFQCVVEKNIASYAPSHAPSHPVLSGKSNNGVQSS